MNWKKKYREIRRVRIIAALERFLARHFPSGRIEEADGPKEGVKRPWRYRAADTLELKPCPFCGSLHIALVCSGSAWYVECLECGAGGSAIEDGEEGDSEEAVERWNTPVRPADPPEGIVLTVRTPHASERDVPDILRYLQAVLPKGEVRDAIEAALKTTEAALK